MKATTILTVASAALTMALTGCKDKTSVAHDHDGDGKPDHGPEAHGNHHEADQSDHHDHAQHDHDHAGHDHGKKEAGPNGGRIITSVEPHAEFSVSKSKKVRITFLDEQNTTAIPLAEQTVDVVCGDRNNPTVLTFTKVADVFFESNETLPEGNKYPVILTIRTSADAEPVREKFILDLDECTSCDYLEYACTCDHHHPHDDHGHDHDDHDHHH
jgi:hypothetical protein